MTIVDTIKGKIAAGTLAGPDLPGVLDAIIEVVMTNEDTKELLQDMADEGEEVRVNFIITGMEAHHLELAGGKARHVLGKSDTPTVDIITDADTAVGLISGKIAPGDAFSAGKVALKGNLAKAMSLVLVLNVVGDMFGVETGA